MFVVKILCNKKNGIHTQTNPNKCLNTLIFKTAIGVSSWENCAGWLTLAHAKSNSLLRWQFARCAHMWFDKQMNTIWIWPIDIHTRVRARAHWESNQNPRWRYSSLIFCAYSLVFSRAAMVRTRDAVSGEQCNAIQNLQWNCALFVPLLSNHLNATCKQLAYLVVVFLHFCLVFIEVQCEKAASIATAMN